MGRLAQPQSQTPDSQFSTTHLDVAAFLLVRGFAISGVNFDGCTVSFAFGDPKRTANSEVTGFYNGAKVPANAFAAAQKQARELMWAAKRGNGRTGLGD